MKEIMLNISTYIYVHVYTHTCTNAHTYTYTHFDGRGHFLLIHLDLVEKKFNLTDRIEMRKRY